MPDYETMDRIALERALLEMRLCPNRRCGRPDLRPVALCDDVWGCEQCHETWYLPELLLTEEDGR